MSDQQHGTGSAHIGGDVNTGSGDFVGRDKHIHGDVHNTANVSGGTVYGPVVGKSDGPITTTYTVKHVEFGNIEPPVDDAALLAEAQQRLAALPVDEVPVPGALPVPSRMPLLRNDLFVGRDADLRALAQALKAGTTTAIGPVAAATGMGGIGKTQLACEFAYRYGHYFVGGVWWLNFADAGAVKAEIAACGGPSLHPGFADLDLDAQVWLVQQAWESTLPRLLIFDNCEEIQLLMDWKPRAGGCALLLTSRRAVWPATMKVRHHPLGVLERPQSIALLRGYVGDAPAESDLDALAAEVGDLPLALHLSGSYLQRYARITSPATYLAQLQQGNPLQHRALEGWKQAQGANPTRHEDHVLRTFSLSFGRLDPNDETDRAARDVLARSAYLASGEPIPVALLATSAGYDSDDPDNALMVEDVIQRLLELGLIEAEVDGAIRLHRLISTFVRAVAEDEVAQRDVEQTILALANQLNNAGYPAPLLVLQPHLRIVTDRARGRTDEAAAGLCNTLGYHLQMIGDYAAAQPYYERALAINETSKRSVPPIPIPPPALAT